MIYELRTYTLVPGKQGEYLKLSGDLSRKIRGDDYGKLVPPEHACGAYIGFVGPE